MEQIILNPGQPVPTYIDWTTLGQQLRESAKDAHGELPAVHVAYSFLLDNPECFIADGLGEEWPANMPQEPNIELIAAYYGAA